MITICRKRNGQHVPFDAKFIENAIRKAQEATGETAKPAADIAKTAVLVIEQDYVDEDGIVDVEECQEAAERALFINGLFTTLMAYHEYRKAHSEIRKLEAKKDWARAITEGYVGAPVIDDITDMTSDSVNTGIEKKGQSWRVKQNASVSYSIGGNVLNQSSMITEEYWLDTLYDPEIAQYHRQKKFHLHDLGWLGGYCAGWNLKDLIERGITGVPGKISSGPAHHLQALCNQMTNFLGIMQNEWAGAQAFSSFDTYLAPFVKADRMTYKEVKQAIQSFVFGINTPSRWGCVDTDTEVLSADGFKKYNELKEGDQIYTWNDGRLELNPVKKVIIKPWNSKMHSYKGRGYNQTVNTEHRVLCKKHNSNEYMIRRSEEIFGAAMPYALPVSFRDSAIKNNGLTDPMIILAAMVYTDGSFDTRGGNVHKVTITKSPNHFGNDELESVLTELGLEYTVSETESGFGKVNSYALYGDAARYVKDLCGSKDRIDSKFLTMSEDQADLFLTIWASFDGEEEKRLCQYDNDVIRDQLQQIAVLAGHCSYLHSRELESGKTVNYVKIRQVKDIYVTERTEFDYDGKVWCPNVENGTAVFRKDGCVYISGQCQAPFSNITLDWTIPEDLVNIPAIVGGKPLVIDGKTITYGDCQAEADIINKAFMETMIEGDSEGRGFAYPIPTYSITKDFKWEDTENNRLLFEMAGKYGAPYFSNYINSDMKPSDVRSMCPLYRNEKVLVMDDFSREFHISTVDNLYNGNKAEKTYNILLNGELKRASLHRFDGLDFYRVRLMNGHEVIFSGNHQHLTYGGDVKTTEMLTDKDYLPFNISAYDGGEGLSREDGIMVGAFMGDGSLKDDYTVVYSLNSTTKSQLMRDIMQIATEKFDAKISTNQVFENCINLNVTSRMLRGLIEDYVSGKALDKKLSPKCINRSTEFRSGIITGLLATDGSAVKNRIYTSSEKAVETICAMLSSLGIPTRITKDDRTSEDGKLGGNACYCIKMYDVENGQPAYGSVYIKKDGYMWFRIESVEKIDGGSKIGYCFEVLEDDEPYFMLPCGLVTHNCRLRLDLRELRKQNGGNFGAGENTGSIGVVTINLPQIAYLAENEDDFFKRLEQIMNVAARSLDIKRRVVTAYYNAGLYPYTKAYLPGGYQNHFSTIGLVGMNEACLNAQWIGCDLTNEPAHQWADKVLDFMREKLSDYQEQYGCLFNLEATPAESTAYRFARYDKEVYPDIITAGSVGGDPYYTNSTHLPVGATDDIFDALDIEDDMQCKYTSGTVFHCFLGEKLPNWKSAMQLVRTVAENYRLPYFTLSPVYSICEDHGYLAGEQKVCPYCKKPTEVYSRITGYYRAVSNWNNGKASEFKERKSYDIGTSFGTHGRDIDMIPDDSENACVEEISHDDIPIGREDQIQSGTAYLLFKTHNCPNCRMLDSMNVLENYPIRIVYADDEENRELVERLGIMSAPTLVVSHDEDDNEIYSGVSSIIGFTKNNK